MTSTPIHIVPNPAQLGLTQSILVSPHQVDQPPGTSSQSYIVLPPGYSTQLDSSLIVGQGMERNKRNFDRISILTQAPSLKSGNPLNLFLYQFKISSSFLNTNSNSQTLNLKKYKTLNLLAYGGLQIPVPARSYQNSGAPSSAQAFFTSEVTLPGGDFSKGTQVILRPANRVRIFLFMSVFDLF